MKSREKHDYTGYNEAILRSAEETEMVVGSKYQGWYHHRRDTLTPILDTINKVLYNIRSTKPAPSYNTLAKLRRLQWDAEKVIAMEKTRWSRHLAEVIHNMSFQPKEGWENIRLLRKIEKSHHSSPRTTQMILPSGDLSTINEKNVRVFSFHFGKVLNNMNPTDDSVIREIHLRDTLMELDLPPEWEEFIIAVTELTNNKAPGLKNVTPNDFKETTPENLLHLLDLVIIF